MDINKNCRYAGNQCGEQFIYNLLLLCIQKVPSYHDNFLKLGKIASSSKFAAY